MIGLTQPELPLASAPSIEGAEVSALLGALRGRGWMKARELGLALGWLTGSGQVDDRKIRAAASLSGSQVISGQKGYRLTCEATLDEINHAANWLEHQACEMGQRACGYRREAHRRIGK